MGFQLRLTVELDEKIKAIAVLEQRSKNKEIEYILTKYIAEYESKNGEIELDKNQLQPLR